MTADNSKGAVAVDRSQTPAGDSETTLPAPARAAVGFGDYEVVGELGEGGMGRVYKAVDRNLGRFVAIKVLRSADPFECGRFRGEAELIATLEHPNIIQIFAVDTAPDGRPYIVLEFAEGGSLDRELNGRPLEPRRAAEMMETLARAVQYAHEKNVIHRDLKPANILRSKDRTLKLTDFGLAKNMEVASGMTPSNAVMGTPSYMSPEQAEGKVKQIGPAADVYGLGAILYEMLTGVPPFRGVNVVETLEQVRWAEPVPPTRLALRLPRDLSTICLKCLQKSPSRRYTTAGELADDLRAWMEGRTITARPAPTWERLWRQMKRRPWEAATLVASVLLVALLIGGLVSAGQDRQEKRADAQRRADKEAADQAVGEAKEGEARRREEQQQENARRLRERDQRSLEALNAIYTKVVSKELKATPGLEGLHEELARYYERHIEESLKNPQPDRARLAGLAFDIGELVYQSGLLAQAETMYATARDLYAVLAEADPAHRAALGDAAVKVARVLYARRDDRAGAACDAAEALWAALREAAGSHRTARDHATLQLAEVEHIRGELCRRRSDREGARDAFTRAIEYRLEFAREYNTMTAEELRARPADESQRAVRYLRELGRGYGYRGDEYLALKTPVVAAADRDYWASHVIRQKVFDVLQKSADENPAELDVARFQLARSWDNLAGFQIRHRAYTTAKQYAESALALRKELIAVGPNNAEYRGDLTSTLIQIAELGVLEQLDEGNVPAGVVKAANSAVEAAEKLAAGASGQTIEARERLANALALRAEVSGDRAGADADAARVLQLLGEKDGMGKYPNRAEYRFRRAAMLALRADLAGAPPGDTRYGPALDELERAYQGRYNDKHPEDVRKRRYFKKLRGDPRFDALFDALRP